MTEDFNKMLRSLSDEERVCSVCGAKFAIHPDDFHRMMGTNHWQWKLTEIDSTDSNILELSHRTKDDCIMHLNHTIKCKESAYQDLKYSEENLHHRLNQYQEDDLQGQIKTSERYIALQEKLTKAYDRIEELQNAKRNG